MDSRLFDVLNTGARLLGALFLALLSGALATWMVNALPCQNFGSSFEGACAFSRFYTAMAVGAVVALLLFVVLAYRVLARLGEGRTQSNQSARPACGLVADFRAALRACLAGH